MRTAADRFANGDSFMARRKRVPKNNQGDENDFVFWLNLIKKFSDSLEIR